LKVLHEKDAFETDLRPVDFTIKKQSSVFAFTGHAEKCIGTGEKPYAQGNTAVSGKEVE